MESIKIYEDSLKELKTVKKQLASNEITINMKQLDAKSKEAIIYGLSQILADRTRDVTNLLVNSTEAN